MRYTLTQDQEYILSVLKETKSMRKSQAFSLLNKLDSEKQESYAARCLNQLRHMRKIAWQTDELFTLSPLWAVSADAEMLSAIDIMLDLTDIKIHALSASTQPFKLCFLSEQNRGSGNYAVTVVRPGTEVSINYALRSIHGDIHTVIFLLQNISQAKEIQTSLPHFFALFDNGKYHYFSEV